MSRPIVTVENLGKKYRLNHQAERQRYTALRDVIADKASRLFRPTQFQDARSEEFWALKGVSFEVNQGDVVGIIGRNGAGKSTLLKILSRVTEPTTGRVRLRGRVASLLEVGTGFHPELTGRENIYLNGAILGMTRAEIRSKFDEIVAFAEVERFLDTPVKRYSSGMYVRLAFGVAAHLESEILIVDEVLAVGDAEFQKKCLGKMYEASGEGRSIIFVSHNLAAVKSLTKRGIVFSSGRTAFDGPTEAAVYQYTKVADQGRQREVREGWGQGTNTSIRAVRLVDNAGEPKTDYTPGEPLQVEVELETDGATGMALEVFLVDATRSPIGMASTYQFHGQTLPRRKGRYTCQLHLCPLWLASGSYSLDVKTSVINTRWDHCVETAIEFIVPFCNPLGLPFDLKHSSGYGTLALPASKPIQFHPTSPVATGEAETECTARTV